MTEMDYKSFIEFSIRLVTPTLKISRLLSQRRSPALVWSFSMVFSDLVIHHLERLVNYHLSSIFGNKIWYRILYFLFISIRKNSTDWIEDEKNFVDLWQRSRNGSWWWINSWWNRFIEIHRIDRLCRCCPTGLLGISCWSVQN